MSDKQKLPWPVERCQFKDVKRWASPAAREHVKVDDPPGTQYFCVRNRRPMRQSNGVATVVEVVNGSLPETAILGFAAMFTRPNGARLKADYVLPDYRSKGIGRALIAARLEELERHGIKQATAFCTPMSLPLYLAAGFEELSRTARGIVFCRWKKQ